MKKRAFTLVEIMMVVSIIALLCAVGIPALLNSHKGAKDQMKVVNVDTVNAAKDQWSLLYNKPAGSTVTWDDIKEYVGSGFDDLADFTIDGATLTIGKVGESAAYSE